MKKRNSILALAIVTAALIAVPVLIAEPGHGRGPGGHGPGGHGFGLGFFAGRLEHIKEELDLSDAQAAQIKAIFQELHTQNDAYRDQFHGGLHDVAEVLLANPNDLAGAQAILDRQAAAEKAMKANMLTAASKAFSVLTPDQRAKLAAHLAERQERRERRRR